MGVFGLASLKIANYKCFGDQPQGFDDLKPVNLIIGRNNSGKSTLLDMVRFGIEGISNLTGALQHKQRPPFLRVKTILTEQAIHNLYSPSMSGGAVGGNFFEYGKQFIGYGITIDIEPDDRRRVSELPKKMIAPQGPATQSDFEGGVAGQLIYPPIQGKVFRQIFAERNIKAEAENEPPSISGDGAGVTNAVHQFLNNSKYPRTVVDQVVLRELNAILGQDSEFSAIQARKVENNMWEIFLEEPSKGLIALRHTGSGFKTILLVLSYLHILPRIEGNQLHNYVYAFEELENNLHPAIQRRLLSYIREYALENKATFLLTTHSSIAIDMFSRDADAQIVHVSHDRERAQVVSVTTYVEHRGILDDLDVRASDLLQSNGVIWVEGPSDRTYLNRWIDLWSNGTLKEGTHYQIVFYGGKLLAHIDAQSPNEVAETVQILRINRNAVVLIDSDKKNEATKLNKTKERVLDEIKAIGGMGWVTAGREIEHYVPAETLQQLFGLSSAPQIDPYEEYADLLNRLSPSAGDKFEEGKPVFAENIVSLLTRDALSKHLDLATQLGELCKTIKSWNGLK